MGGDQIRILASASGEILGTVVLFTTSDSRPPPQALQSRYF